eukprot:2665200-Karenia_brevis.AAC.1
MMRMMMMTMMILTMKTLKEHFQGHLFTAIENGVTLVKCTQDGVTGVFDAFGSVLFRFPQTTG